MKANQEAKAFDLAKLQADAAHTLEVEVPRAEGQGPIAIRDLLNPLLKGTVRLTLGGVTLSFPLATVLNPTMDAEDKRCVIRGVTSSVPLRGSQDTVLRLDR